MAWIGQDRSTGGKCWNAAATALMPREETVKQLITTLERTAEGAMVLDQEGKIVFWNRAAQRLLGFNAQEVVGHPCCEVIRGETLGGQPLCSPTCPIADRIRSGGSVRQFDMQTRTKDGRPIWLNVSSLPVPSRKRGVFWIAHLMRDISKQAKVRRLVQELHSVLCAPSLPAVERPPGAPTDVPASLPLTQRERDILRLLATGATSASMADSLCISPKTVRNHVQHILEKLGAHNRLQVLAIAFPPGAHSAPPRSSPTSPHTIC